MIPRATRDDLRPSAAAPLATAGLVLALAACSVSGGGAGAPRSGDRLPRSVAFTDSIEFGGEAPPAGDRLSRALASTDSLDFEAAVRTLEILRAECGPAPVGRRATLLLAAVHLDPRNPAPRPGRAADLAGAYLREGGGPGWTGPVAEVLYLEALEKGGGSRARDGDGAGKDAADAAPLRRAAVEVPDGCDEVGGSLPVAGISALPDLPGSPLASRLEQLRHRVTELEAELERIRRTLEP